MSDICEHCGCPEGVDGHDLLYRQIEVLKKENADLNSQLENSINIGNKNADGELRERARATKLASIVQAAERGRTISDAAFAELQDFMIYVTGDPAWSQFNEIVKKKLLSLIDRHHVMTEWHPVWLAERALIKAVLQLDGAVREFDGDLAPADEHMNSLWDCVKRYRDVKVPVVFP